MRIVYLVNEYPKVSHTFIRREIRALERRGFDVLRVAVRGWDTALADPEDERERACTRYLLQGGVLVLAAAVLRVLLRTPARFVRAFGLALRTSMKSDRAAIYHLAYLAEACRLLPWSREHGATRIHAHFGTNSADVAMLARALGGPPYSFTVHGTGELDRLPYLALDEKIRRAELVIAASLYVRSQLLRSVPHAQWAKLRVVRCGLEREFLDAASRPLPEAPRLVCVGRLSSEKGQLILLEAAKRLLACGVALELVLAGDGPLRGQIEEWIARHRLEARVRVTGWVGSERVRQEIEAARALVLPSFAEGLPVVLMEAMAAGRPVIATAVGGVAELVRHGTDGWLVPPASVAALSDAMRQLLATPLERLRAMGEAACARVRERHSIERESAKLARLFSRACGREREPSEPR